MKGVRRAIASADRKRILRQLEADATTGGIVQSRNRALILLAWGSGLRLQECCNLDVSQVLERGFRIRSLAYLQARQAKGRRAGPKQWHSGGSFTIPKDARSAMHRYLKAVVAAGWMRWPALAGDPLFLTERGRGAGGHHRVSKRTVQHHWEELQRRAGVREVYVFHELRHDALTRVGRASAGDVFRTAAFGRCSVYTAQRYVHSNPHEIAELAERAAAGGERRR